MRRTFILTLLLVSTTLFAQDTKAPELKVGDQLAIVKLQKQLSDYRVQYNQLFQQWLQSEQVTQITAESIQTNQQINAAIQQAIKNAQIDTNKWVVNTDTLQVTAVIPAPKDDKK